MRTALAGGVLLGLGAAAVAIGVLSPHAALAVGGRTWPVLLFVVAIAVVTELASDAGVFTAAAARTAIWGAHRAWLLWIFVVVLSLVATVFLSLDTTAVLLTPVVVLLARHGGLPPLPFALTTVWLANTGSLLLPVSNLTNLLSEHVLGFSDAGRFAALMALPALAAVIVPCAVILVVFRRDLTQRYDPAPADTIEDRVLFRIAAAVVVLLVPLLVSGLPVWIPACAAAAVLGGAFAVRRPGTLRFSLLPWQLVLFACGLFLVVQAGNALGLTTLLGRVAGTTGDGAVPLLRLSGTAALGANLVDNLPAYLAVEPVAGSTHRIAALLIGTNVGSLVTPWASLATLLWHSRLTALDVHLSWTRYAVLGAIVAPLGVVCATLTLVL